MNTARLEAALRRLGWAPDAEDTSVATRAWRHEGNARGIRVPRTDWVHPRIARRILRQAHRVDLR